VKVLHVLDHSLPIGSGYSYRSRSILAAQRRLGLEPVVLTSPKQGSPRDGQEIVDGVRHYRTGPAGGRLPFVRELALMWKVAARLVDIARREKVEVVHAHSPLLNGLPAVLAGRRLGLPVVYEVRSFWEDAAVSHGSFREGSMRYRISRALDTLVLRRADRVVAICEGIRREVARRGVAAERIAVVPNGVEPEWLIPRARADRLASQLGIGQGPVFGYLGSFSFYEGLPFLVEAAPDFLGSSDDGRLLLVGGGRDEAPVRALARKAGGRVIVMGRVPQEQVPDIYTLLDVLVLPRRRMRLTELVTPLKPLEAMAMSRSVLASDVGGHAELIQDGTTGLLFEAESRDALVTRARALGADSGLRERLGRAARRYVSVDRNWDRLVARYLPVYAGAA
jgi:PEP-CTERM/exosortase A-associated glycosyltransferase